MAANLDGPITLAPYDPTWPQRFEHECAALDAAIGDRLVGPIHQRADE